jgi:hypothetical protein
MPAPALAALARFLPMLEGMAASGGTASGLGAGLGAAEGGGIIGSVGRLFGTSAFGTEAELGAGLRKISDLSGAVEAAKQAMEQNRQRQEEISSKAREDERQFAFSDPGHTAELARLAREHQAQQQAAQQSQRQMLNLQQRAALSTDPSAQRAATFGKAATIVGAGAMVASAAPSIIRNSAPVQMAGNLAQAGANLGSNFTTPAAGNIIGQMGGTAGNLAGTLNPANMGMSLLKGPLGPLQELTKAGVEIAKLPGHIQNWSQALIDSQKIMARYNPVLARMVAEEERRGIIRGVRSGQTTGGATSDLSDAMQDLLDQVQPMKDTVTVVLARGLTTGVQLLGEGVKLLGAIWEVLKTFPGAKDIDALIKAQEETSRLDARFKMLPLERALKQINSRDKSKPKSVPKR